jgi:hypothetical protein
MGIRPGEDYSPPRRNLGKRGAAGAAMAGELTGLVISSFLGMGLTSFVRHCENYVQRYS